uniref:Phosphatidylinositol-specific phospholipase C X domain-containing protein n=1 Tax=Arcella intermedia TaxID=1963864 RepID=A0A6B2LE14_9EUKA
MGNVQRPEYDSTPSPSVEEPDWMSNLDDKTSLAELSIVGTNHSVGLTGGDAVQTQAWTLDKQLRAGVRAIDIHVRHHYDDLVIYVGNVSQSQTYKEVEDTCIEFLKENPSEFILLSVQKDIEELEPHARTYYNEIKFRADQQAMYYWKNSGMPTVGQVRGRIVLIGNLACGIPGQYIISSPEISCPTLFQLQSSWNAQKQHLSQRFPKSNVRNTIVSASSPGVFPYSAARNLNEWFMNDMALFEMPLGLIWFNFPGTALINKIIRLNSFCKN